ncbi:hypothetical protein CHL78_010030 [Romboutsia weinsteinii]|uniref:Uncharacterized protein n=1 Tax=Romboutsia weinsteinii TaxID=2020949 RepID=A0A371J3J9_9FIRM|nr:hypothetical protein [Romboutsia weinsteinii]RDY27315.1 hypothetical protein CHL78_010030 [Romboutsia weinsteinii]
MDFERDNNYRDLQEMYDKCKSLRYYHSIFKMKDGCMFDGIIEDVDMDRVIILVAEDVVEDECGNLHVYDGERQFGGRRRFRRFRRRSFPLGALLALSLLRFGF